MGALRVGTLSLFIFEQVVNDKTMNKAFHYALLLASSVACLTLGSCGGGGGGEGGKNSGGHTNSSDDSNNGENNNTPSGNAPTSLSGKKIAFHITVYGKNNYGESVSTRYYRQLQFFSDGKMYYKERIGNHVNELAGTDRWTNIDHNGTYTYQKQGANSAVITYTSSKSSGTLYANFISPTAGNAQYIIAAGSYTINFTDND